MDSGCGLRRRWSMAFGSDISRHRIGKYFFSDSVVLWLMLVQSLRSVEAQAYKMKLLCICTNSRRRVSPAAFGILHVSCFLKKLLVPCDCIRPSFSFAYFEAQAVVVVPCGPGHCCDFSLSLQIHLGRF